MLKRSLFLLLLSLLPLTADCPVLPQRVIKWRGQASWYGQPCQPGLHPSVCGEHGRQTYCRTRFDLRQRTIAVAAELVIQCGARVRVTRLDNGLSVELPVTDRLPSIWYRQGRIADLSHAAAAQLGIIEAGLARIELIYEPD